jgi:hypothetical protein
MNQQAGLGWIRPDDHRLLLAVCLVLVLLIGLPSLFSIKLMVLVSPVLLGACFMLFSVQRTLLVLLLLTIILPAKVLEKLRFAGGLQLEEVLFLMALVFALVELVYRRALALRTSGADLPTLAFFAATLLSATVGLLHDNALSQILRDIRFPFYYMIFFLVTNFVDAKAALRLFLAVLVLAGFAVSAEYILEFLGAIDLSDGTNFVRVARLQGIILPIALLFIINQFIYDPRRYGRLVLLGVLLPIGLAFILTMGRGMWAGFAGGLLTVVGLYYFGQPTARRRSTWRTILLIAAILVVLGSTVFLFQRFTGSNIGAHMLERSRSFVDPERDIHVLGRLFAYSTALEAIAQYPVLGNGQGATLTFPIFNPTSDRFEIWSAWSLDSLYLTLLWKMGLIGLTIFAWLSLRILRLSYRTFKYTSDPHTRSFASSSMAALVAMLILGVSNGSMVNGRFSLVFGIMFGMIAVVASGLSPGSTPPREDGE